MNAFERWEKAKPFLERAVPELHGTHTIDDIALMVGSGHFTVWLTENSALLTEFCVYPRMKVMNFFLGGGDKDEMLSLRNQLAEYAKANGCSRVTGGGRVGWNRFLPKVLDGYQLGGYFMFKDL